LLLEVRLGPEKISLSAGQIIHVVPAFYTTYLRTYETDTIDRLKHHGRPSEPSC
jgi:hypothetical protein